MDSRERWVEEWSIYLTGLVAAAIAADPTQRGRILLNLPAQLRDKLGRAYDQAAAQPGQNGEAKKQTGGRDDAPKRQG